MKDYHKDILWKLLMNVGRRREKGIVNKLTDNDVQIIIDAMGTFRASDEWINQTKRDLLVSRYRVFDWLGMYLSGEFDSASKILTNYYIASFGNVRRFINNLENIKNIQN